MTCKVCNSNVKEIFSVNGCKMVQCSTCKLIQMLEEDSIKLFQYDKKYFESNKYKSSRSKALIREHTRRVKLIKKYCNISARILDVGCATGEFVAYAADYFEIEGCDISQDAIHSAQNHYPNIKDRFWQSTIEDMHARTKQYDALCLWDVIEHISNPMDVMNLTKYLKRGAYFFISTPNSSALFAKIMRRRWPFMTPPEHLCLYSKKSIIELLDNNGFDVIKWSTKGKWANLGFILYKANRVTNNLIPNRIVSTFSKGNFSGIDIYVPTKDIQYIVARKR